MKQVSEIKYSDIADYLRLDLSSNGNIKDELETYLKIAKNYISNYTGIPETSANKDDETLDTYPDFIIVVYVLCQHMYDYRSMYVDEKNINKVVQNILDMHQRNLL